MIFNEFRFLFLFLPAVLLVFYLPGMRWFRPYMLIISSLVFYAVAGLEHTLVLIFDVVWVYALTQSPHIKGSSLRLAVAAIPPLLALGYYKYLAFFLDTIGLGRAGYAMSPDGSAAFSFLWDIALPAGVSFFTFQVVSFAIDRYRGDIETPPSFKRFALFITFFPQLVAGPIVRYEQMAEGLQRLKAFMPSAQTLYTAILYILGGMAMKVLIADGLARSLAPLVAAPETISASNLVYLIGGYSFQIYFDFYGYSLVAIGLALLFGISLPVNFLRPYSAANPRDFWRRWHVSLSFWIRDYVYKPLGGNQHYIRNIAITFALCGLWHGAAWTFVIWGLYHAALVVGYKLCQRSWDRMPTVLQIAMTFVLVSIGWMLFIFDFATLGQMITSVPDSFAIAGIALDWRDWAMLAIAGAVCFGIRIEKIADCPPTSAMRTIAYGLGCAGFAVLTLLFIDVSDSFIYFRF